MQKLQVKPTLVHIKCGFKSFVTFYIMNFLILHIHLSKAFEVCGILEYVFVARKHNVYGEVMGL